MKHFIYLLIICLLGLALAYILLYFFPIQSSYDKDFDKKEESAMFWTGLYPAKIQWITERELLTITQDSVQRYDIENRESTVMLKEKTNIVDARINDTLINIIAEANGDFHLITIDGNTNKKNTKPLPNADHYLIGKEYICITTIRTILHPKDTATEIRISPIAAPTEELTMKSNLTLIPLNCDSTLFLIPPLPLLQDTLYFWNTESEDDTPTQFLKFNENNFSKNIRVNRKFIGVESGDHVTIIDRITATSGNPRKNSYNISDETDAWGITNNGDLVLIDKDKIGIRSQPSETLEIPINAPGQSFVEVFPSPNLDSFALISEDRELWILRK